ncbi:MAG: phosphoribosylanthranilate isomerase [Geminicoccaceae bacterium]|nr:phosphoribosylanthranilate isomerase [Geminicoccaceae bacterium]
MAIDVKICGITNTNDLVAAVASGAAYLGFVFYPPSPRNVDISRWKQLASGSPSTVPHVGVMVDPEDRWIDEILETAPLDYIQLHGRETPGRTSAIRERSGVRIIKAIPVRNADDVDRHRDYLDCADMILFDAKPPATAGAIPGGNGISFDWRLLAGHPIGLPWILAGGLDADNVAEAVRLTGASTIDASSRIESEPGLKNHTEMKRLLTRASTLVRGETRETEVVPHDSD